MSLKVIRTIGRRWRRDRTSGWLVVNGKRRRRPRDGQAQSGGRRGWDAHRVDEDDREAQLCLWCQRALAGSETAERGQA